VSGLLVVLPRQARKYMLPLIYRCA
jgi:hypothetical protein